VTWRFEALDFESGVFGAPVGRVVLVEDGGEGLETLIRRWMKTRAWLVSARVSSHDKAAAKDLTVHGFTALETLVTLERALSGSEIQPDGVRLADVGDGVVCMQIAHTAFAHDRFHADARISDASANRLKETWVANAFKGRADVVLIVEENRKVVGFVTCQVDGMAAIIDLIAVAPGHQGRGIGKALVQGTAAHYADRKAVLRVGTQDTNTPSLALYEGLGFARTRFQDTYHWVNEKETP